MSVFPAASKKHVPEAFSHLMYDPVSYFLEGLVSEKGIPLQHFCGNIYSYHISCVSSFSEKFK